jgi:general stress protein CsbA
MPIPFKAITVSAVFLVLTVVLMFFNYFEFITQAYYVLMINLVVSVALCLVSGFMLYKQNKLELEELRRRANMNGVNGVNGGTQILPPSQATLNKSEPSKSEPDKSEPSKSEPDKSDTYEGGHQPHKIKSGEYPPFSPAAVVGRISSRALIKKNN